MSLNHIVTLNNGTQPSPLLSLACNYISGFDATFQNLHITNPTGTLEFGDITCRTITCSTGVTSQLNFLNSLSVTTTGTINNLIAGTGTFNHLSVSTTGTLTSLVVSGTGTFNNPILATGGVLFGSDGSSVFNNYTARTSWTPGLAYAGTPITKIGINNPCYYTRVGDRVTAFMDCSVTGTIGAGNVTITNLPVNGAPIVQFCQGLNTQGVTFSAGFNSVYLRPDNNASTVTVFQGNGGSVANLDNTNFYTGSRLNGTFSYFV